jgi:signal peptidase
LVATPRPTASLFGVATIAAMFQISLFALAGVLLGLGESPYSSRPAVVAANLVYILAVLAAIELTRACVVVVIGRTNPTAAIAVGTIAFALIRFPIAKLASIDGAEKTFSFLGGDLLPALAIGLVASVLALAGGPLPAIVYGALLQCFEWLSPILPDLNWATTAFVGTLGPVLVLAALQPPAADLPAADDAPHSIRGRLSLIVAVAVVSFVWFAAGFFGIQPVAVSGPSMEPAFHVGDLVIVQDVDPDDVVVGDVVRYKEGSIEVVHRVVEVRTERGRLEFITQGDANNTPDDPISGAEVTGRVVHVIPKLGWPSIALRAVLN